MKICFDMHGTFDTSNDMRKYFRFLEYRGHEVYILSGAPSSKILNELEKLNFQVKPERILSVEDIYRKLGITFIEGINKKGKIGYFCDETLWNAGKSIICHKYKINILIDDQKDYEHFFSDNHPTEYYHFELGDEEMLIKKIAWSCKI